MQRKAFTLIELLVVIAIIAILAAILFPVFAQARDKARSAACLSNTKQLAIGVQMYSQDYDELLPVAGFNAQCRGRWQWQIFPYVKNENVFTCPNISSQPWRAVTNVLPAATCADLVPRGTQDKGGYGWSYALQADNGNGATSLNTAPGYSLASIAKPADTVIIGETGFTGNDVVNGSNVSAGWAMMAFDPRLPAAVNFSQPGLLAQGRHNTEQTVVMRTKPVPVRGRLNVVFLDGHSKNMGLGQLFEVAPVIGGVAVEDGVNLVNEENLPTATPTTNPNFVNHTRPNIRYRLFNIY